MGASSRVFKKHRKPTKESTTKKSFEPVGLTEKL